MGIRVQFMIRTAEHLWLLYVVWEDQNVLKIKGLSWGWDFIADSEWYRDTGKRQWFQENYPEYCINILECTWSKVLFYSIRKFRSF